MFPLDFPLARLARARAGEWVLDPFCGRGTTMFAARLKGLNSVGIDASPVAAAIASAKVARADPREVESLVCDILQQEKSPVDVPVGEFWDWAFHPETLNQLCWLREQLASLPTDHNAAAVLRAIVLGILHGPLLKGEPTYLSNQMPRTYATKPDAAVRFWSTRAMAPPRVSVLDTLTRRIRYTLAAVPIHHGGAVYCGDAAEVLKGVRQRFDWIVTSPPYYRMYTYVPDQWLRSWFLGGPPHVDYSTDNQLRHTNVDVFVDGLAAVWDRTALRSNPGARLAVRFGALPSVDSGLSPEKLLRRSLDQSGRWKITRVHDSGRPGDQARQASQMGRTGAYANEVDVLAVLR
ncbi:DNA methyltransferase [Mycobacterium sp. NPDC050441]|uniref:DNA methyltransferase n=1 Tax=Mycobacterium sp. NPDC050441 TaxID=3155403 RepID=UPI0034107362